MKTLFLLLSLLISSSSIAGGGTVGNGGDPHVIEFLRISGDICDWAKRYAVDRFPQIWKCKIVTKELKSSLESDAKAKIEFVAEELYDINGISKVAIFNINTGSVKVNRSLWRGLPMKDKYVTAGIEMAGLSGVERRYEFGSLISLQFVQMLDPIKFPEFTCSLESKESTVFKKTFSFSDADLEIHNKMLKKVLSDPTASCGICTAGKEIVIQSKIGDVKSSIKIHREYLIDRPFKLIVSQHNENEKLFQQSSIDAKTNFFEIESLAQGLVLKCEKTN